MVDIWNGWPREGVTLHVGGSRKLISLKCPSLNTDVTQEPIHASNEEMVSIALEPFRIALDEDICLVERFLGGDSHAFTHLYEKYYDRVLAIARGVLLNQEEALDAVQEIFTLVYRHLPRFDRRARFSTWLFRIAVNRSIQQARKIKHRSKETPLNEALESTSTMDEPADPQISEALRELPPNDRAILTLFYWEELQLGEIAESIGCSSNAAKTRLYRARERFRQVYEEIQK